MTYLLLGEEGEKKEAKIQDLKRKLFSMSQGGQPSRGAEKFDYEVFYGNKLDLQTLQESLLALPAVAGKRLILVRDCHKLNPQNKKFIAEFDAQKIMGSDPIILILESNTLSTSDSFVKKLKPFVEIQQYGVSTKKTNVFDMTRAMTRHRQPEAIKILSGLLMEGVHPLQIMGGLVWFWGKQRRSLVQERFEKGLGALQEADLNIKRSRLRPDYTLELLVVKLCGIL